MKCACDYDFYTAEFGGKNYITVVLCDYVLSRLVIAARVFHFLHGLTVFVPSTFLHFDQPVVA